MTTLTLTTISPDVEKIVHEHADCAFGLRGAARWRAYERAKDAIASACIESPEEYDLAIQAYVDLVRL